MRASTGSARIYESKPPRPVIELPLGSHDLKVRWVTRLPPYYGGIGSLSGDRSHEPPDPDQRI
jgi:hypothetical protein